MSLLAAACRKNHQSPTTDPDFTSVEMLLHFQGTNGGSSFPDSSMVERTVAASGAVTTSAATHLFGATSGLFAGGHLTTPYVTTDFDWWTGDYTLECWIYTNNFSSWTYSDGALHPSMIACADPATTQNYWSFGIIDGIGTLGFYYYNGAANYVSNGPNVPLNQWNHLAFVHSSAGIQMFVNGISKNSPIAVAGTPVSSNAVPLSIGSVNASPVSGNLYDIRITRAVRYTQNFNPPTAQFPDS